MVTSNSRGVVTHVPATNAAKVSFTKDLFKSVNAARPNTSNSTAALLTAHAAYESGWGTTTPAKLGFNYWNLTAGSAWEGPVILGGDTEFNAGSAKAKPITQKFRKYSSAIVAVQNYFQFLSAPRYRGAKFKLLRGDSSFVVDLGAFRYGPDGKTAVPAWPSGAPKGGFYTLPIERYAAEFRQCLLDVQVILATDGVVGVCQ